MNMETNIPKLKGFTNPLTKKGVWALVIVLGVIVAIAGVVYVANTPQSAIPTEIPTITPLIEEATSSASPSPIREVGKPTGTPTPTVEGITVTPAPTI